MMTLQEGSPEYYGNLCRVAVVFAVRTGNPAEFDAAEVYARAAVRAARVTEEAVPEFDYCIFCNLHPAKTHSDYCSDACAILASEG